MSHITKEALLEKGFVETFGKNAMTKGENLYIDDDGVFVYDGSGSFIQVTNCKTLEDLDNLIKLFS